MEIKVLGGGCAKCKQLLENAKQAATELSVDAEFVYETDFAEIAKAGIMSTPALMIDGKVVSTGKLITVEGVKEFLNA